MIVVSRAAPDDFAAILALQDRNHLNFLPEDARGDGFLTTYLDVPKLDFLVARGGLFVAKSGTELAGFACCEAWDLSGAHQFHSDVVAHLPLRLADSVITARNSLLYGPACVAAPFRGQGVLAALVEAVKTGFREGFEFALTFIDSRNQRSLAAHGRKLGFQSVGELPYDTTTYHMLAFRL